jgi:UDPglucose 6-dehydrogenase
MNITVAGTGYVGLVTGTCLAEMGNHVTCIDLDESKILGLKDGVVPIFEPGLDNLVHENTRHKRIEFSTDLTQTLNDSDVVFIAVGTPPDEDGSADLKYVLQVAKTIGENITSYNVIVTKSTVPVGTSEKVKNAIKEQLVKRGVELDFDVASNPEFLKEGAAVEDFMKPDRIIIGTENDKALDKLRELYAPFNRSHEKIIAMDVPSAELTKYAANSMLATKISFMNEVANLAELLGADIEAVRRGIGSDPRIGYHFIYPGCGYGGSCFPKDVQALARTAREHAYQPRLLDAVEQVNNDQKHRLAVKLKRVLGDDLRGMKIALWGLAFKPDTDDMREAPSRVFIEDVLSCGASVVAFDPVAAPEAERIYAEIENVTICSDDPYIPLENADALVVVTEWKMFRTPDVERIKNLMKGRLIVDGRNMFDPESFKQQGFIYHGIGRS